MTALTRYIGVVALLTLMAPQALSAQQIGGNSGAPIEIEADQGIEWLRDQTRYVARGNAVARQDGVEVHADTLVAHYGPGGADGGQAITRLDANGTVRIVSEQETVFGDQGVYHADQQVAVVVGKDLRMVGPKAVIHAKDQLEYWQGRQLAVARGDATVTEGQNRLRADVLTAYITDTGAERGVSRIDAIGNIIISTPTEIVRGREGVYDVKARKATICGAVKITRGNNQLNGECAEVNMTTGRSKLLGKVRGLILPGAQGQGQ